MRRNTFSLSSALMYLGIGLYAVVCVAPMILSVMVSVTDEDTIRRNGYSFIPAKFSLYAYELIFQENSSVMQSYLLTIAVTVIGTIAAILITMSAAYTLANKSVRYRNHLALFFYVTVVFTAGMVPWYMMCSLLGLKNNILALIVPSLLFNPFNLFLAKNFIDGIPDSLRESATIDGAGEFLIAWKIYAPLCTPIIATIGLFYGLAYWNDWWNAIMLVDDRELYPLQFLLMAIKSNINMLRDLQILSGAGTATPPAESVSMATAIVTIGPIVFLYPFVQRYFVKGMLVGSIKG